VCMCVCVCALACVVCESHNADACEQTFPSLGSIGRIARV
jgi:hypothetical protein